MARAFLKEIPNGRQRGLEAAGLACLLMLIGLSLALTQGSALPAVSDPLNYISVQDGANGRLTNLYNLTGSRASLPSLPRHWFIKDSMNMGQTDYEDINPSSLLSIANNAVYFDLGRSFSLTKTSMERGLTKVYPMCSTPITGISNFTVHLAYGFVDANCDCQLLAGLHVESVFLDGNSDTTYSIGLLSEGAAADGDLVARESLANGIVYVSASPSPDLALALEDKTLTFCIVPACGCGMLIVKDFVIETA